MLAKIGTEGAEKQLLQAGHWLRGQVVKNISTPTSLFGPSKKGEFPHADTGRLRQSIFVSKGQGPVIFGHPTHEIRVGTNLSYGLLLEYVTGRSYLRRTLRESMPRLRSHFRGAKLERQ